jgi:cytochrome c-type biogenesis protein CcmH/NrfF
MKKIILGCLMALCLFAIQPVQASTKNNTEKTATPAQVERANQITARLYEIKSMDKSHMTSSEKKVLRQEVRAMKKEMSGNGGIYLSVGAVIIIILLLILLL